MYALLPSNCAAIEIDAVIDAVIAVPGVVAAIALQLPMADESRLRRLRAGETKHRKRNDNRGKPLTPFGIHCLISSYVALPKKSNVGGVSDADLASKLNM